MPYIASIGTYLPCWGSPGARVPGDDEDAITLAVEAGRAAVAETGSVQYVVLVSRDLPLLESSNAAVLLAGLGLDPEIEVTERLGGAPATLDALGSARPRTLVIGVDLTPAGAAAALYGMWKNYKDQSPVEVVLLDEAGEPYVVIRDEGEAGPELTVIDKASGRES